MLIQFVDFSVLLFDFRSVFFDASLRVEERLLDESGIGLLHVWETLDAEVLHDLFDLLLQVEHFGLEFCSLRRFWREREGARDGACVSSSVNYCRRSRCNGIGKGREDTTKSGEEKRTHDGHEFRRLGGVLRASRH